MFPYQGHIKGSPDSIRKIRLHHLLDQLRHTADNSPYYRRLFAEKGIEPGDIKSLKDFSRLPVTTKEDLRGHNDQFIAVPVADQVDMCTTSGTTGNPVFMPVAREDLNRIALGGAQTLSLTGLSREDIVHLTLPMGAWMWMAGFGFYICFTCLGSTVLRFGPGFTDKSLESLIRLRATAIMAVPSFALKLGKAVREKGLEHHIQRVITIAENVIEEDLSHNALGFRIKEAWGSELFSCYGVTEGTFMGVECTCHQGHHINPMEVYLEVLDPDTLKPLPPGERGLVTITPLGARAFPLLRYVTGDISFMIPGVCPCGRMLDRIGPVLSRKDHMVKVKGVMVYPEGVKKALSRFDGMELFQLEAIHDGFSSTIRVLVPCRGNPQEKDAVSREIRHQLGVTLPVRCIPEEELRKLVFPPEVRKPVVFVDRRQESGPPND